MFDNSISALQEIKEFLSEYENISDIPENVQNTIINYVFDEFIIESISSQIDEEEMLKHKFNYLQEVIIKYNYVKILFRNNSEFIALLEECRGDFYGKLYQIIENKFHFNLDEDIDHTLITPAIYEFFIINLYENLILFVINFINHNKKPITQYLSDNLDKKSADVIASMKKHSKEDALIICRMADIFEQIVNQNLTLNEFIQIVIEDDNKFSTHIILTKLGNYALLDSMSVTINRLLSNLKEDNKNYYNLLNDIMMIYIK